VVLVACAAAVVLAFTLSSRGGSTNKAPQLAPAQKVGDDADLMRRLERHKLVQRSK
jgi:hypothetical protein